jgi:hypothetical protein
VPAPGVYDDGEIGGMITLGHHQALFYEYNSSDLS